MEDMYCDSDYNNVILFTVIDTFYTCQTDVDTEMTVGMFVYDAEWRNVHSTTLYEYDLVQLQHVEVWR